MSNNGSNGDAECPISFEVRHGQETTHNLTFKNINRMCSARGAGDDQIDQVDKYEDDGKCLLVVTDSACDKSSSKRSPTTLPRFTIDIDTGAWWKRNADDDVQVQPRLRLFLEMHEKDVGSSSLTWWSLHVEQLFRPAASHIVKYKFKVEASLDKGAGRHGSRDKIFFEGGAEFIPGGDSSTMKAVLKKRIAQLDEAVRMWEWNRTLVASTTSVGYRAGVNLLLKVSVTPTSISARCRGHHGTLGSTQDIKLETSDDKIFSASKAMILINMSPYLARLINSRRSLPGFNGTVRLPDVTSNTLHMVLTWINTALLPPNWGKSVDEVVDAADKFEMPDLIWFVNTNLGRLCTADNMIPLYRLVQRRKNQLPQAFADISRFVKRDLEMD